jgi:hypothetical protein
MAETVTKLEQWASGEMHFHFASSDKEVPSKSDYQA